jgi:hypothetical protein
MSGCAGSDPPSSQASQLGACPKDTAGIQREILVRRCGTEGCHVAKEPSGDLDLTSAGLEARLVGHSSSCGAPLVKAGDPGGSYLMSKLTHAKPECGAQMPSGQPPLPAKEIECLSAWISGMEVAEAGVSPESGPPEGPPAVSDGGPVPDAGDTGKDAGPPPPPPPPPICVAGEMACGQTCVKEIPPTLDYLHFRIFKTCANSSCHGAVKPVEGMDLSTPDAAYASLVNTASKQRPELMRVNPGHPELSYIINKLTGVDMAPKDSLGTTVGKRMPTGFNALCTAKIDVIRQWITDGALR